MENAFRIYNAHAKIGQIKLSLDVDAKSDIINHAQVDFLTDESHKYQDEMDEILELIQGRKLSDCLKIKRSHLQFETKNHIGNFLLRPLGLTLLHSAIEDYLGDDHVLKSNNQIICSCFNVTITEIKNRVIKDKNFDINILVKDTKATSGCSSCLENIKTLITKTRNEYGLIKGLDNSRSRLDANGKWIKISNLYPADLLIKLDQLKNQWLIENELDDKLDIEFTDIEGMHLTLKLAVNDDFKKQLFVEALSDYLKEKMSIQFFLHAKN